MSAMHQNYVLDMDLDEMCRICLSQTDVDKQLFNIFSSTIVDGFLVAVPDVIRFCVDLQVLETDGLPNRICQCCRGQLLKFYIFKQKCRRTEEVLRKAFPSGDKHLSSVQGKPSDAEACVDEYDTTLLFDQHHCELCDKVFSSKEQLRLHSFDHIDSIDENYGASEDMVVTSENCYQPGLLVEQENARLSSVAEENAQYVNDNLTEELDSNVDNCNSSESTLEKDQNTTNEEEDFIPSNRLTCKICNKTIKKRSLYLKHVKSHDAASNMIEFFTYHTCEFCKKVFLSGDELSDHCKANNHVQGTPVADVHMPYSCGNCSSEYAEFDHVRQHLLSHLSAFPCPFEGCGCEYTSSARLEMHINSKHIEYESHKCPHCGIDTFNSMVELQQHLRVKCSAKKFHCGHCDKKFLTSRSLALHMKSLEKGHRCKECGKSFAQQGELKIHSRIHNGERPFQCTVCGKRFKTASLRTAHMDSHIDGKTFQCEICDKKLQTRTCYRNHIRRHSEEKQHGCDICNKKFYTKYNLKVHKEKVHKIHKST